MGGTEVRELTVDKEFAGLCQSLKPEELSLLEASLEREGCRDPIVVWANNGDTIIDGHNRYRFCRRFGVAFKTKAIVLEDRNAVRNWIVDNQLARRNCTEEQKAYLRGQRYITEKRVQGGTGANQHQGKEQSVHNEHSAKTADALAAEYKVGESTIRRDADYADAIDTIAKNTGDMVKQEILSGTLPVKKKDAIKLATLPADKQREAVAAGVYGIKKALAPLKTHDPKNIRPVDPSGAVFTGPALAAAEECKRLSIDALDGFTAARKALVALSKSTTNAAAWMNVRLLLKSVSEMRQHIKEGAPHSVCSECKGHCCAACQQCGFLNKGAFEKRSKQ